MFHCWVNQLGLSSSSIIMGMSTAGYCLISKSHSHFNYGCISGCRNSQGGRGKTCVCVGGVFKVLPPRYAFFVFFLSVGLLCPSCFVYILQICMPNKTRFPPILHPGRSQCEGRGQTPEGTQLLFWYRCSARRAGNGGLKNGKAQKTGA